MDKVFLLVNDWSIDYEHDVNIDVYETLLQAQEAMINDAECWKQDNEFPNQEELNDDTSISIEEIGDYTRNHINWFIVEKAIILDKELHK